MSKSSKPIALAATLAGLLALAPAHAQGATATKATTAKTTTMTKTTSKLTPSDTRFVKSAAQGGMEEVELGKLAAQKASSPEVKAFGQRMVDDHSKANDQLKQLAAQKGVTLSPRLSPAKKAEVSSLSRLSGAAFDRKYVSMMVEDHKKDVGEFEKESRNAKDADLKGWSATTLPTLQDHLKSIEDIHAKMGKGGMSH